MRAVGCLRPVDVRLEQGEGLVVREEFGDVPALPVVVGDRSQGQHPAGMLGTELVGENEEQPGREDGLAEVDGLGDAGEDGGPAAWREVFEDRGGVGPEQFAEGDQVVVGVPVQAAADGRGQRPVEGTGAFGLEQELDGERVDVHQPAEDRGDCCRQLCRRERADEEEGCSLGIVVQYAGQAERGSLPPLVAVRAGREGAERVVVDRFGVLRAQTSPLAAAQAVGEFGEQTGDGLVVGGDE